MRKVSIETLTGDFEAIALLAQQIGFRNGTIVEDQIARRASLDAELILLLAHGQAVGGFLNNEGADAFVLEQSVGRGEDDHRLGFVAIRTRMCSSE